MPRMDGTGPMGLGAKTCFRRGVCMNTREMRREMSSVRGFGHGRGFCRMAPKITKDELIARKAMLQNAIADIEAQLDKM